MQNLSEQEIRAIVRDEIRQMVGVDSSGDINFMSTSKAYKELGYASPQQLRQAVYNGTFRLGKEVQDRRSPSSAIANYYFNIQACIKRLNTLPDSRNVR